MLHLTRRHLLIGSSSLIATIPLRSWASEACNPTPPTQSWESPPEYIAGAPERASFLEADSEGQRMTVTGRVLTTHCEPVVNARLEFWHTNPAGKYDMTGFKLRGFQRTDKDGNFRLESTVPGRYMPVPHIHFLLGARVASRPQAVVLTNVIELPIDDEAKRAKEAPGRSRRPNAMSVQDGVLSLSYDIILDIG